MKDANFFVVYELWLSYKIFFSKTNYKFSTHKFKRQELLVLKVLHARHIFKNTLFWMVDAIFQGRTGELSVPIKMHVLSVLAQKMILDALSF